MQSKMLVPIILAIITFPMFAFYFTTWFWGRFIRHSARKSKRLSRIADALAFTAIFTWDIYGFWPTISTKWMDGILFVGLTFALIVLGIIIWRAVSLK